MAIRLPQLQTLGRRLRSKGKMGHSQGCKTF